MWAPVSQHLVAEQPSDKTRVKIHPSDKGSVWAMGWPGYLLTTEWVSHEIRKRDKHVGIWQPPETLPYLPESKSAHIASPDSNTGVRVLLWSCVLCALLLLSQFQNYCKTVSDALAQFEFHCTVGWPNRQDFLHCCLGNESFQPWRKTIWYF